MDQPQVVLRLGSHSEKEYFEKLAKSLDGLIFGANLLESTPAATSSLILSLKAKRGGSPVPFYVDPMTYCFGPYIDPNTGNRRLDLEAIKSERLEKRGATKKTKAVKSSYVVLANCLGVQFKNAVDDGKRCHAIDPEALSGKDRDSLCEGVLWYQQKRVHEIISEDEMMRAEFGGDAIPSAIFAPYFFVHKDWLAGGLTTAIDLAFRSASFKPALPVHAVLAVSRHILGEPALLDLLISELPRTGVVGVWLWFDGFDEQKATVGELVALRRLVSGLSVSIEVFNMHGGYYSLMLSHEGLKGVSHGVGYGEKKPIAQVIGAAPPTVRYYLPAINKRVGIADLQRSLAEVGVESTADFLAKVCSCQICAGVISRGLAGFSAFGELHRATKDSKQETQTPTAAKLCRFHFLINRFKERNSIAKLRPENRAKHLADKASVWRNCRALLPFLGQVGEEGYLEIWEKSLE